MHEIYPACYFRCLAQPLPQHHKILHGKVYKGQNTYYLLWRPPCQIVYITCINNDCLPYISPSMCTVHHVGRSLAGTDVIAAAPLPARLRCTMGQQRSTAALTPLDLSHATWRPRGVRLVAPEGVSIANISMELRVAPPPGADIVLTLGYATR